MKRTLGMISALWLLLLPFSSAVSAREPAVVNGDFEDAQTPLRGWTVEAENARVDVQVSSGQWRKCTVRFNTDKHTKANLFIGAYNAAGRCWLDNLQPSGFALKNPGFEDLTPDGKACVGWSMDSPGSITHVDSVRVSEGRHSVMMFDPSYASQMFRVWQVVDVTPNTECSYTFDFYMENDFYGGIRCSAIAADTPDYYYLGGLQDDLDAVIADRSFAGTRQCRISLDGGVASLTQEIRTPADAHLEAAVSLKIKRLSGEVALEVEDAASGKLLAAARESRPQADWIPLRVRFKSVGKTVRLRLSAKGEGELLVDGVRLSYPALLPQPQRIAWRPAADSLALSNSLTCSVRGESADLLRTGLDILRKDLSAQGVALDETATAQPGLLITIAANAPNAPKGKGDESYYLSVNRKGVVIAASTERGAFYALMTLLQLLTADSQGAPAIVACKVSDWPDLPWRSIFSARDPEWMARRKFNRAESGDPARFEDYQRHGIIFIPHDNITHYPYKHPNFPPMLQDPNYAEGVAGRDTLTLSAETPAELSGRNVLRTKLTNIEVRSADGKTLYTENKDYTVIPGDLELVQTTILKQDGKPFALARIPAGAIPDGAAVVVTYEYAGPNSGNLCLAEVGIQEIVAQRIAKVVAEHKLPFSAAHVSESAAGIGKGPRSVKTGLSPSQLLANYFDRVDRAVKQANPACRLFMWTDDFLPWQHAPRSGLADMANLVPKDAVMGHWYYGPGGTVEFNLKSAKLWTSLGHDFTLMGWYDYYNIRATAAVALWARRHNMPCLGTSSWAYPIGMVPGASTAFIDEVARCAWRVPRKGEPGYIRVQDPD